MESRIFQYKRPTAPVDIDGALIPKRMCSPKQLQGAVMREDAVRMHGTCHQERIGTKICRGQGRRYNSVYLSGNAFQATRPEVVLEPFDDA
ncbi:MAG: hypothetical protein LLG97_03120 [Deltaproteobacteria bacterium]|nr:hypothetical protein [Deltaproteobacteria bacterium]